MADGELVTADLYIAATGVKPNIGFLEGSGVAAAWGVAVDRTCGQRARDLGGR
jgi:NADPH-dependent 2,4-dienoyl-CoA reductase/sulfur reductase-like enzyme